MLSEVQHGAREHIRDDEGDGQIRLHVEDNLGAASPLLEERSGRLGARDGGVRNKADAGGRLLELPHHRRVRAVDDRTVGPGKWPDRNLLPFTRLGCVGQPATIR